MVPDTWKSTQRLYRLIKPHSLPSAARAAGELRDKVGRYLGSHFTREVLPTAFESGAACEKSAAPILVTAAALVRSEEPRDRALGTSIASTFAEIWQSQQSCNTALNSMMISLIEEEQQQQQQQLDPPSSLHPSNTLPALSTVQSLPSDERPPPLGSKLPETDGQKWSAIKKTMDCLGRQQRTVTVSDSPSLTLGTGAGAESLTPMVETGLKRRQNASTSGSSSTRTPRSSLRPKSSLTGKCRQSA